MTRLILSKETLRTLQPLTLHQVRGGEDNPSNTCPESMLVTCYTCDPAGCVLDETGFTGNCYTAWMACDGSTPGTR